MEFRPFAIAKAGGRVARLIRQERDQAIGGFGPADSRKPLADQSMLFLQPIEQLRHRGDGVRRGEQPQRMAGGRSVDDDGAVGSRGGEATDFDQPDELVDSRQRQIEQRLDVGSIEPGAMFENIAERAPVLAQPARERARSVELDAEEGAANPRGRRGQAHAERITERVRGIG